LIIEPPIVSDRLGCLERSLERIDAATREPVAFEDDDPVFVASIGWRCGSTLLQRALMTDPSILIWGEPLDHLAFLDRLIEPLLGFTDEWPGSGHWISHREDLDLARDWVATLAPDAGHLKAAYRAFFDHWLGVPARQRGFRRWGVKQVRWSGLHGVALRWLYPRSRFVVIVRHPVSAYYSMRNVGFDPPAWGYLVRWPDRYIATLDDYAGYWNSLATSWADVRDKLGATVLRYEDVVEGRVDLDAVGASLGLNLKAEIARSVQVGGPTRRVDLSPEERDRINELTKSGRALFAYDE
jgi:hypothetical protein